MRIGIITDVHENVEKLAEAICLAEVHKCDELVCLGDIAGFDRRFYSYNTKRSAKACLDLIRSNFRWIVVGNHDLFATSRFPSYSNGFVYPHNWFTMDNDEKKRIADGRVWCYEGESPHDLGEDDILFLNSLPEYIITHADGISLLFSHYIFPDFTGSTTRYIERNHHLNEHWRFMKENSVRFSFSGHSHASFTCLAYERKKDWIGPFLKAIHSVPYENINLGKEMAAFILPALTGEKGRPGFSMLDTETMKLEIISINAV